jgi:hypothetical protein
MASVTLDDRGDVVNDDDTQSSIRTRGSTNDEGAVKYPGASPSVVMWIATCTSSLFYIGLAASCLFRLRSTDLNSSARAFFGTTLATTLALYSISIFITISQAKKELSLVPILVASMFGSIICFVVFGF